MKNRNIIIFLTFLLLQYIIDRLTSTCDTKTGELLLFIHHIVSAYIYMGGILFNPLYHLIFIIITMVHWITNNNRCALTVKTNQYCGYSEDKKFRDFLYYTNISKIFPNILYLILIAYVIYDGYRIYKK